MSSSATLTIGTLTIDGKEYAVIPLDEYRRAESEMLPDESVDQDLGDSAELARRKAKEKPIPYAKARKMMGLE